MDQKTIQDLEQRFERLENKFQFYQNVAWVVFIIMGVFGVSGGWGYNLLISAKTQIDNVTTKVDDAVIRVDRAIIRIEDIEGKVNEWEGFVIKCEKRIEEKTNDAINNLFSKKEYFLSEYNDKISEKSNLVIVESVNQIKQNSAKAIKEIDTSLNKIMGESILDKLKLRNLSIVDDNNKEVVTLTDNGYGGYFSIQNSKGSKRISMYSSESDDGYIRVYDSNNVETHSIGTYGNGKAFIRVLNGRDADSIVLDLTENGGGIVLSNGKGQKTAALGGRDNGDGFLNLKSNNGNKNLIIAPGN